MVINLSCSRERFGEMQARLWWEANRARIQEQYLWFRSKPCGQTLSNLHSSLDGCLDLSTNLPYDVQCKLAALTLVRFVICLWIDFSLPIRLVLSHWVGFCNDTVICRNQKQWEKWFRSRFIVIVTSCTVYICWNSIVFSQST